VTIGNNTRCDRDFNGENKCCVIAKRNGREQRIHSMPRERALDATELVF
jgi:hypothetical protein